MTQERKRIQEEEKLEPKGIVKNKVMKSQESHWREKFGDIV